tara:strand:- start:604 stop:1968 length:1365 start_codon:yes stop_codon:yes gene_type:complete
MAKIESHQVKREDLGEARVQLQVEVPKAVVQAATKSVSKQILKYVKVPGFRRDKTPLPLVKRSVGKERFNEYLQRELLPQTYYEALDQEGVRPISEVEYDAIEFASDSFKFTAKFSIAPEFKVGDYKKLKVDSYKEKVATDDDVNDFLQELASKQAEMEDFESDTETAKGHWVSLLVKGKVDGEDSKFLRHYNTGVVLGKDELYPKFDKELMGKKKMDRVNFDYKFTKNYENKALAGKTASFEVKILGHKNITTPKIDDDFAKKMGPFEDVKALTETVKAELGGKKREEGLQEFRKHLQDSLHEVIECEVPQTLIDELSEAKMQDLKHGLSQKNKSFEEHLSAEGKSEDELKQQMHNDSERELKLSFALTDIAIKEGLNVEDIEVNQRIAYTAHALRKNVDEILEYVESLGRKVLIRSEIMQEKALGFLEELYRKDSLENESESVSKSSKESAE